MKARPILFRGARITVPNTAWDYSDPDLAYLLGVIHGDGHVATRSISISVSYKEPEYAAQLIGLLEAQGFSPKTYRPRSALRIDVHNSVLTESLRRTKARGLWTIPADISISDYLAGVIDTDGHVTKAPARAIVITLKRSGNLGRLSERLLHSGLRMPEVKDRQTSFDGKPYLIEELKWSAMDQMEWMVANVRLRHPRKAWRLAAIGAEIAAIRARVPLWRLVAEWLSQEPRDIDQIMERWNLTKRQADSALDNIKSHMVVEVIPPPRALTKYLVRRTGA
jgi:hypothetical protein